MIVPIDLLPPILDDLLRFGRVDRPPRPWLGLFATDAADGVVVTGAGAGGPAARAGLPRATLVTATRRRRRSRIWAISGASSGPPARPGSQVKLTVSRDGRTRSRLSRPPTAAASSNDRILHCNTNISVLSC